MPPLRRQHRRHRPDGPGARLLPEWMDPHGVLNGARKLLAAEVAAGRGTAWHLAHAVAHPEARCSPGQGCDWRWEGRHGTCLVHGRYHHCGARCRATVHHDHSHGTRCGVTGRTVFYADSQGWRQGDHAICKRVTGGVARETHLPELRLIADKQLRQQKEAWRQAEHLADEARRRESAAAVRAATVAAPPPTVAAAQPRPSQPRPQSQPSNQRATSAYQKLLSVAGRGAAEKSASKHLRTLLGQGCNLELSSLDASSSRSLMQVVMSVWEMVNHTLSHHKLSGSTQSVSMENCMLWCVHNMSNGAMPATSMRDRHGKSMLLSFRWAATHHFVASTARGLSKVCRRLSQSIKVMERVIRRADDSELERHQRVLADVRAKWPEALASTPT